MYIVALMDGDDLSLSQKKKKKKDRDVVASETQYFAPKNCFDLNEPLQEGIISLLYFLFTFHLS